MIEVLVDAFADRDVSITEKVRVAALDIRLGVTSDEGVAILGRRSLSIMS